MNSLPPLLGDLISYKPLLLQVIQYKRKPTIQSENSCHVTCDYGRCDARLVHIIVPLEFY